MPILVLLFIVVPIAELYVIIQVGQWIGVLPTLAILVGDALLGSWLLRQQGRAAWLRFNAAIEEQRFPGRETADGVMIVVGGTLLLTPGFITDVAGLLLLIPPTRALIRRGLFRFLRRRFRVVEGPATWGYERMRGREPAGGPGARGAGRPYDVEGTGHEVPSNGAERPARRADDREPPALPPS
ncbi:MAG: FxsA family protein [Actinomycetota bacterium]